MASTDEASASERWLSGSVRKDGARDLLSGMISGFFCKVLEYPFDTIKVLEQTGGAKFSGPLDAARKTVAESGVLSLYDGLAAPLIGSMAECASLFVAYGVIKSALGVDEEAATLEDNPNPNPSLHAYPNPHPNPKPNPHPNSHGTSPKPGGHARAQRANVEVRARRRRKWLLSQERVTQLLQKNDGSLLRDLVPSLTAEIITQFFRR